MTFNVVVYFGCSYNVFGSTLCSGDSDLIVKINSLCFSSEFMDFNDWFMGFSAYVRVNISANTRARVLELPSSRTWKMSEHCSPQ